MKLFATLALAATLSIGAFGGIADATNAINGASPYYTTRNAFGLLQCANWYVDVGEAISPAYLYVNAQVGRDQGEGCAGGHYPGAAGQVARINYRLFAWSSYGNTWYVCWNWDAVVSNGGNSYYAQDFDVWPGCGVTWYYVQSYAEVKMDPGSGVFTWYGAFGNTPSVYPVWLNG